MEYGRTCGNGTGYLYRDGYGRKRLYGLDNDSDYARYRYTKYHHHIYRNIGQHA